MYNRRFKFPYDTSFEKMHIRFVALLYGVASVNPKRRKIKIHHQLILKHAFRCEFVMDPTTKLCCFYAFRAGSNVDRHSPKPIRMVPFLQYPLKITVSLSLMNFLSVPSDSFIGFCPRQVNSSIDPYESGVGPEMFPLPIISPLFTLQPLTVWCANCWLIFQYIYLKFDVHNLVSSPFSGAK